MLHGFRALRNLIRGAARNLREPTPISATAIPKSQAQLAMNIAAVLNIDQLPQLSGELVQQLIDSNPSLAIALASRGMTIAKDSLLGKDRLNRFNQLLNELFLNEKIALNRQEFFRLEALAKWHDAMTQSERDISLSRYMFHLHLMLREQEEEREEDREREQKKFNEQLVASRMNQLAIELILNVAMDEYYKNGLFGSGLFLTNPDYMPVLQENMRAMITEEVRYHSMSDEEQLTAAQNSVSSYFDKFILPKSEKEREFKTQEELHAAFRNEDGSLNHELMEKVYINNHHHDMMRNVLQAGCGQEGNLQQVENLLEHYHQSTAKQQAKAQGKLDKEDQMLLEKQEELLRKAKQKSTTKIKPITDKNYIRRLSQASQKGQAEPAPFLNTAPTALRFQRRNTSSATVTTPPNTTVTSQVPTPTIESLAKADHKNNASMPTKAEDTKQPSEERTIAESPYDLEKISEVLEEEFNNLKIEIDHKALKQASEEAKKYLLSDNTERDSSIKVTTEEGETVNIDLNSLSFPKKEGYTMGPKP